MKFFLLLAKMLMLFFPLMEVELSPEFKLLEVALWVNPCLFLMLFLLSFLEKLKFFFF